MFGPKLHRGFSSCTWVTVAGSFFRADGFATYGDVKPVLYHHEGTHSMFLMPAMTALGNGLLLALESGIYFDIRQFCIIERISDFFTIALEAFYTEANVDFDYLIGQRATFELHRGNESRLWSGILSTVQRVETAEDGLFRYSSGP